MLGHLDIATGEIPVTETLETTGQANSTHTEPYVAIPSITASGAAPSYTAAITNPITSVGEEDLVTVASASSSAQASTTELAYGRFLKKDVPL